MTTQTYIVNAEKGNDSLGRHTTLAELVELEPIERSFLSSDDNLSTEIRYPNLTVSGSNNPDWLPSYNAGPNSTNVIVRRGRRDGAIVIVNARQTMSGVELVETNRRDLEDLVLVRAMLGVAEHRVSTTSLETTTGIDSTASIEQQLTRFFEALIDQASDEVFEDGMESNFSARFKATIFEYGLSAIKAVGKILYGDRPNVEIVEEILRQLGSMDDETTGRGPDVDTDRSSTVGGSTCSRRRITRTVLAR